MVHGDRFEKYANFMRAIFLFNVKQEHGTE
jgi:hypothetical protein